MTDQSFPELKVPGLRAHLGDWVYYVTFLRLRDIAERISLVREIHTSKTLNDLIQREVDESTHSQAIRNYLLRQKQRFFNALVIGVYGGSPQWVELAIDKKAQLGSAALPAYIDGALGILSFQGTEKLFAIDGQHRVVGIKRAIEDKPAIGDEELTCIFIAHSKDRPGMERTRRLFTTLNRYAKPVSKMESIALDEDDVVAIVTRRLLESYPLFRDWTSARRGKSIPTSDRKNFTTIVALYDALDRYLAVGDKRAWRDFKRVRPSDTRIKEFYDQATELWNAFVLAFPALRELLQSSPDDQVARTYRSRGGGHLLFRPVGLHMSVYVTKLFLNQGVRLKKVVTALADVPMLLTEDPWVELLYDATNRRMTVSGERQKVATRLLYYGLGGSLALFNTTREELRAEWAGLLGREPSGVRMRRWASL